MFSKELLENANELYRSNFDGSQDHDMVLRLTERAKNIVHIPKVLYYWRVHPDSVSMNLDSKSYAVDAAIRAIKEQLIRENEHGSVSSNLPYRTIYRISYDILQHPKVIILVHNNSNLQIDEIKPRIDNNTSYDNYEIIFVEIKENETLGIALNRDISHNKADFYVLFDGACIPENDDWIEEMLMYAQRNDVCTVSPKILFGNNLIGYAGLALDANEKGFIKFLGKGFSDDEQGYEAMFRYVRNITASWKGCCMISAEKLRMMGGFSEDMDGYEEVDFSLRGIQNKLWNVWTCFAKINYDSMEIPSFEEKKSKIFYNRWQDEIKKGDRYYHPILKELRWL